MLLPRLVALLLLLLLLLLVCLAGFASGAAILPPQEVESLRQIGKTLKRNWDFSVDPCNNKTGGWVTQGTTKDNENAVQCDCNFQNFTICHVVNITKLVTSTNILKGYSNSYEFVIGMPGLKSDILSMKSQDLTGSLPPELVGLPFLQSIDLTRNYLNGTIPPEWGSMNLTRINLSGNRITGPIPKEIANIRTLTEFVVEFNQLTGPIPAEFGNLPRIQRLLLSSNNLTGPIPESLAKMTTLFDLRLNDNNFNGSIPNFIGSWTNMTRLEIQASGLSGPIPTGIASLAEINNLRISDLNGNQSTNFLPSLSSLKNLEYLILRSCNIVGRLPNDLGGMAGLKLLDLSFNKLSGSIPDSYSSLADTDHIYLTGNSLNGTVPAWMQRHRETIDLSYNNFIDDLSNDTSQNSGSPCPSSGLNLFASSKGNTTGIVSCLKRFRCPRDLHHSVHINCGGGPETDEGSQGTAYEEDLNAGGPSNFFLNSRSNWAFSSTGHFLNDERPTQTFIPENLSSVAGENPRLYMNARISPLSLTFYGFCLSNGNYTVYLHFAEIMFSAGNTFGSLGRRIFDVYIQGKLVLKDFNIENAAGGVNRGIRRNFTAVVNDNTIDIRFYWAGKGTSGIPYRVVYGPLISAISVVDPNYTPPPKRSFPTGAIVGIVVGVISAVLLFAVILWKKGCFKRKDTLENELKGLDLHTGSFTLRQIKAATNNFDPANKIGEGGFGPVYKGLLLDGTVIAVKQLSSKSKQGNREFVNEIGMISALQHPHLVKLYGCCIEGNQLLLIYEYLENNSLARALFGPQELQLHLDWPTRQKISIGIARGLAYLHEESRLKIVHRDIKATNVLLDKDLTPKISDFGLAKLDEEDNTHISTRIAGTFGYMAPEYAMRGYLTDKADVYSFGVVLLEIVSGRSNNSIRPKEESFYILDWANALKAQGNLMELIDPRLGSNFNKKEVFKAINLALLCTNAVAAERPSMSSIVSILEGKGSLNEFDDLYASTEKKSDKEMVDEYGKGQSISMDVPWTSSTASASDLYPITVDTEYWEKRDQ